MTLPVTPFQPPAVFDQQSAVPTTATLQNAATADGNGTDFDITGMATVQLLVNPTSYTGTVTFWASPDGTTFDKIKGNRQDTTTIADNVANPGSTASIWTFQTAALTKIRAVLSSSGGTSVTVTGAASPLPNSVPLGVTLSSTVLAAGTALIGTTQVSDGTTSSQKLAVDSSGNASVNLGKYAGVVPVMAGADGNTAANVPLEAQGRFNGATVDQVRTFTKILNFSKVAVTAATPVDSLTPTSGKKFRIITAHLTNDAGKGGIKIQSVSGTNLIIVASGSATPDLGQGVPADAINHHLFIDVTDTGNVSGFIGYSEE